MNSLSSLLHNIGVSSFCQRCNSIFRRAVDLHSLLDLYAFMRRPVSATEGLLHDYRAICIVPFFVSRLVIDRAI